MELCQFACSAVGSHRRVADPLGALVYSYEPCIVGAGTQNGPLDEHQALLATDPYQPVSGAALGLSVLLSSSSVWGSFHFS